MKKTGNDISYGKSESRILPHCVDCLVKMVVVKEKSRPGILVCVCPGCKKEISVEVEK